MRLASRPAVLAAALFASLAAQSPGHADYIDTFSEVGPNVVANGSGSINLTGLTPFNPLGLGAELDPFVAQEVTGPTLPAGPTFTHTGFSGPTFFGPGASTNRRAGRRTDS